MQTIIRNELMNRNPGGFSNNPVIEIGEFKLSVQYGEWVYCIPKQSLPPEEYTGVEVAIINNDEDNLMKKLRQFDNYEDLLVFSSNNSRDIIIFEYLPILLLEKLYVYLLFLDFKNR